MLKHIHGQTGWISACPQCLEDYAIKIVTNAKRRSGAFYMDARAQFDLKDRLEAFLAKHCTQTGDHDAQNCHKCFEMKLDLAGLIVQWCEKFEGKT